MDIKGPVLEIKKCIFKQAVIRGHERLLLLTKWRSISPPTSNKQQQNKNKTKKPTDKIHERMVYNKLYIKQQKTVVDGKLAR